ncbi:MAG: helix-turn-helix transcriptional regulator [bacterium]
MTLGERIAKLRESNNLTQQELAEKLNYTAQAISKWENGTSEPKLDTLREIANVFNVTLSELLEDKVEENKVEAKEDSTKKNSVIYKIEEEAVVNKLKFKILSVLYSIILCITIYAYFYKEDSNMIIPIVCGVISSILFCNYYYKVNVYSELKQKLFNYQCNIYLLSNLINKTNGLFIFIFKIPFLLIDLSVYLLKVLYLVIKSLFVWGECNE